MSQDAPHYGQMDERTRLRQKFHKGDLVKVAADLGDSMRHFPANCRGIVTGSYAELYGAYSDSAFTSYRLFIEGHCRVSWYDEHQLTLIAAGQYELLEQWEDERESRHALASAPSPTPEADPTAKR